MSSFFTVGNLLTLGIVFLALVLYHQLTRRNSSLDRIREYGKRLRGELDEFVEKREAAVRDYAVDLEVKHSAAKALLERLVLTDQELQAKAEAIAKIDERISGYDASLEELVRMTGRVQENLNRVRDEGDFVENAIKRIGRAEEKIKDVELELQEMQNRFEKESAESMERVSEAVLSSVRVMVSDLQATAETIERRVEDHKEAVTQVEKQREENLERDLAVIGEALEKAVLRAGERADKLEDDALAKLREQATGRLRQFRDTLEEKLKAHQEESKARIVEVQGAVRDLKDSWKKEHEEFTLQHQSLKDTLKQDINELNTLSHDQKEAWKAAAETVLTRNQEQIASLEKTVTGGVITAREQLAALEEASEETRARITREIEEQDAAIAAQAAERGAVIETKIAEQERAFAETAGAMESRIGKIQAQLSGAAEGIERKLSGALAEAEAKAKALAGDELAKWKTAAEDSFVKWREAVAAEEERTGRLLAEWEAVSSGKAEDSRQILEDLNEAVKAGASRAERIISEWEASAADLLAGQNQTLSDQLTRQNQAVAGQLAGQDEAIAGQAAHWEELISRHLSRQEEAITAKADDWDKAAADHFTRQEEAAAAQLALREESFTRSLDELEDRMGSIQSGIAAVSANIEERLTTVMEEAEAKAQTLMGDELEKWQTSAESSAEQWKNTAGDVLVQWREAVAVEEEQTRALIAGWEASARKTAEALNKEAEARSRAIIADMEARDAALAEKLARRDGEFIEAAAMRDAAIEESAAALEERLRLLNEEAEARSQAIIADMEARDAALAEKLARRDGELTETAAKRDAAIEESAAALEERLRFLNEEAEARSQAIIAGVEARDAALAEKLARRDGELTETAAKRDAAIEESAIALEERLRLLSEQAESDAARIEAYLADTMKQAETQARSSASGQLEAWRKTAGENLEKWRASVQELDEKARKVLSEWDDSAAETTRLVTETGAKVEGLFKQTLKTAADEAGTAADEETKRVDERLAALDKKLRAFEKEADETVAGLEKKLANTSVETGRKVLEETDARLDEYRAAQARQYEFLDSLAEDSVRLDGELRRYMQETENRVRQDFALFEETSNREREASAAAFTQAAQSLRKELDQVEKDLDLLKAKSYDNVSKQLDIFESDFTAGLTKRGDAIEEQLGEWKSKLDSSLSSLGEDFSAQRQQLELNFSEELRERLLEQRERLTMDLDHLKAETAAFEESIRNEMAQSGETLGAFKQQLEGDMDEARSAADIQVKAELGRFSLSLAENLKQAQRDLAASLKQIADRVDERGVELSAQQDASREEIGEWEEKLAARIKDTDGAMEEVRRRVRELVTENEERLTAVRTTIEEVQNEAASYKAEMFARVEADVRQLDTAITGADRRIQEFITQTRLFEQADTLKQNLEQRIEDLHSDIDGLDQRRAEASELEAQFVKIKRLEDEVNAKMTRFLSEQRRIELMEADFNRLLQTSQAVETKLTEVTASDDTLQAIQVQIRKFNDALSETEEKFQRIEKKGQTLETINQNVDRNFTTLKKTETELKRLTEDLKVQRAEQETLRISIEKLTEDNENAQNTADKLTLLEKDLSGIEGRIKEMQKAREWIARAETRLEDLNKEIQDQVKLVGNILKEEGGAPSRGKGAPTLATRDNVIKLARQGWKVDEIAKAVKLSRGEVELILDLNPGSKG